MNPHFSHTCVAVHSIRCTEPACNFVGQSRAGLVNHTRQRHGVLVQRQHTCPHCNGLAKKQKLYNHACTSGSSAGKTSLNNNIRLTTLYLATLTANGLYPEQVWCCSPDLPWIVLRSPYQAHYKVA